MPRSGDACGKRCGRHRSTSILPPIEMFFAGESRSGVSSRCVKGSPAGVCGIVLAVQPAGGSDRVAHSRYHPTDRVALGPRRFPCHRMVYSRTDCFGGHRCDSALRARATCSIVSSAWLVNIVRNPTNACPRRASVACSPSRRPNAQTPISAAQPLQEIDKTAFCSTGGLTAAACLRFRESPPPRLIHARGRHAARSSVHKVGRRRAAASVAV